MEIILSPNCYEDYEILLRAKQLPRYEIRGCRLIFPDEYASLLDIEPAAKPESLTYTPKSFLYDYQAFFSRIAIQKQKFALFFDCGVGKTMVQLEFARHCRNVLPPDKKILVVTPLMVVQQFLSEAERFYGDEVRPIQIKSGSLGEWASSTPTDDDGRIGITNWEAFKNEVPTGNVGAIVADETGVLKSHYGVLGRNLIDFAKGLEWKMAGTGTPAPNDCQEYAHHAVFLDAVRSTNEFLARYFVNRGETANRWELRPHAKEHFYRELSHWCVFLQNPATYGFKDNAESIPPIHVHVDEVPLTEEQETLAFKRQGTLFAMSPGGITQRNQWASIAKGWHGKKAVKTNKPKAILDIIQDNQDESVIVWCLRNREQDELADYLGDHVTVASIAGSTKYEDRMRLLDDFKGRRRRVLISKPSVLGFGLNLQVCTRMIFSGCQDSYEAYYQAVKRANRIGSTKPLNVHIPVTDIERPMVENVLRKAARVQEEAEIQEELFKKESRYD